MKNIFILMFVFVSNLAFSNIEVSKEKSQELWKSIDVISKIENLDIIKTDNLKQYFILDDIACVFEEYEACSFYTEINNQRKLIVTLDGSTSFIKNLIEAGIKVNDDYERIDVDKVTCSKSNNNFACTLVEFQN